MSEEKIAFYQIHLVYKDGKDLSIEVSDLDKFFKEVNSKEIFWIGPVADPTMGYWINLNEVRLIQIKVIKGVELEENGKPDDKTDEATKEAD